MALRVDEATIDEASILHNLGELYVHDFSEITFTELNDAGASTPNSAGMLERRADAVLLRVDNNLAGFAIVRPREPACR